MKIKFNWPKIEIIHSYSDKESKSSILCDIYKDLKYFIYEYSFLFILIIYLLICSGFYIAAAINKPDNKFYSCKIISIKEKSVDSDGIKTYEGYLQYNKYRFIKKIDVNEYEYIYNNKLNYLDVNTNIYTISNETSLYSIFLWIANIMIIIFIILIVLIIVSEMSDE